MTGILFQPPSAAGSLTLQERQNVPEVAPSVFSGSINFRVSYINPYFSRDKSNRGGEIRTMNVCPKDIGAVCESSAESSADRADLFRVFDSWRMLTTDDRRRIIAIVNGRLA